MLTHARTRRVWGEVRMQDPSRFLADLPAGSIAQPMRKIVAPMAPRIVDGNWTSRRRPRGTRDEMDQRAPDDDVPVYRVDDDIPKLDPFRTGDQVTHEVHGVGRVVAVVAGAGARTPRWSSSLPPSAARPCSRSTSSPT